MLEHWILLARWGADRVRRFRQFMTRFAPVPSSRDLIVKWAEVMVAARGSGRRIAAPDAWIAATAPLYSASLMTHNPADYVHQGSPFSVARDAALAAHAGRETARRW
jgi:predicted nucleic acid-binding protein